MILLYCVFLVRHTESTQNTKFEYFCNISRKKWAMNFFCFQINAKVFYKVVVSFWMCVIMLAQSIQNKNLQNLWKQEEWSWFFGCRKTSNIASNWCYHFRYAWPGMPKLPQKSFLFLCNILRKKWAIKLFFDTQIKLKITYKLILWFLMKVAKHSQSFQNRKGSLQCLYNIFKKELEMKLTFCIQINIKTSYKFIWKLLSIKFFHKGILSLSMIVWLSILKVLKVKSLQ